MSRGGLFTPIFIVLAIHTALAVAAFDQFFFAGNATKHYCTNKLGFGCPPPSVCVHDDVVDKFYCCKIGTDAICNTAMNVDCRGANGGPSGTQDLCDNTDKFCCIKDRERCTGTRGQINVCWATAPNPVANWTEELSNAVWSSMSSARPSATSYSLNIAALLASATASSSASASASASATPSASPSASPSPSPSPTPSNDDGGSSGLSGGAIGGIVGGILGGLALIGVIAFFLWRRRRANRNTHVPEMHENTTEPYSRNGYYPAAVEAPEDTSYYAEAPGTQKYAHHAGGYTDHGPTTTAASELQGEAAPPAEMPGSAPDRSRY